jgi:hypothetical protein
MRKRNLEGLCSRGFQWMKKMDIPGLAPYGQSCEVEETGDTTSDSGDSALENGSVSDETEDSEYDVENMSSNDDGLLAEVGNEEGKGK